MKHDENCTRHYLLIVQSFAPESTSPDRAKNPFEFVMVTTCLVKQDEPSFTKRYETPSTHYLWCVPILLFHPGFVMVRE